MQSTCRQCQAQYEVNEDDLAFYDKVSPVFAGEKCPVPPPVLCPDCRQQRRLAWRNEQNFYRRSCDLCKRQVVSSYPSTTVFPVYCNTCWWSDKWDPLSYGIDLDPTAPFLQQWKALRDKVPQLAMQNDDGIESENCEYCYDFSRGKNCYLMKGSWYVQDCHYGLNCNRCKNVVDGNTVSIECELVYESLDSQRLYHCAYVQNCENCHDCWFGYDLKGCHDCFCCFGLRQKRFCIYNKQYSEEEYRQKMSQVSLGSHKTVRQIREQFDTWVLNFPRKYANFQNCEGCEGNNLFNCKNVLGYSVFNSEHSKFIDRSDGPVYSYDLINTGGPQWCLDSVTPDNSYMALFSVWCWKCKNILFSDNCHSSEHLLGCIAMRRARYCILNKQYSKEEYEKKAKDIIESLIKTGEWGNLLPITLSPYGYNESAAAEYYPLSREEVTKRGWKWTEDLPFTTGKETVQQQAIPDDIRDVPASFSQEILACITCGKNYKVIPKELEFYKQMPVPVPRECPQCRHLGRFRRKNPTRLWERKCNNCTKPLQTTYAPDRPEKIFCDECYLKEVY